jgi:hypothetical protein
MSLPAHFGLRNGSPLCPSVVACPYCRKAPTYYQQTRSVRPSRSVRVKVAHVVRWMVSAYDRHPIDINSGDCHEFATELVRRLRRGKVVPDWSVGHAYAIIGGFCYDAEAPYGVRDPRKLPYMVRYADPRAYPWPS